MNRSITKHRTLPFVLAALSAVPLGTALTTAPALAATKSQTFKGPLEYADHGPVQVSITVKNKKITGVKVATSPENGRSVFIQNQAIPVLKQETLRAQSGNIDVVSGATDTSSGYIASLQAAVSSARKHRALK